MRLLDTTTLKLKTFIGDQKPEYAILSHTWGDDEVLFEDIQNKSIQQWKVKAGADKVVKSAKIAAKLGIAYIWIDTCSGGLGGDGRHIGGSSVHTKMVWASRRTTTRAEDRAYSLMGLFDVNMPLLYGEGGERAFERLQDEIIKRTNDQSILLHGSKHYINHLAKSPDDFTSFYKFMKSERDYDLPFQKTSDGIDVSLGLCPTRHGGLFWGIIEAHFRDDPLQLDRPAFQLNCVGKGSTYQRNGQIVYRVQRGDEGQMEVVDESERYKFSRLARYDAKLYDFIPPPTIFDVRSNEATFEYYYGPLFTDQFQLSDVYLHLVDIQSWPEEKATKADTPTLEYMVARLSRLPIVTQKHENPSMDEVASCIGELGVKYDHHAGTSIVMSNGVRVNAWTREEAFLEEKVYHLHMVVDQHNSIPSGNTTEEHSSGERPKKGLFGRFR
ncbi:hypothetical protein CHU98_g5883 [Xylaria longipes]|nr:hypothetical protein CHU98_g5883 [Xylaria longipes]